MALASGWTVYVTSNMVVGTDLRNSAISGVVRTGGLGQVTTGRTAYVPMVASGSLFFYAVPTVGAQTKLGNMLYTADLGVLNGTLQTALRINEAQSGGNSETGILCMQSISNLTVSSTGNGYGLAWVTGISALTLFRFSGGLSNKTTVSTAAFPFTSGTNTVIQLAWAVSGSSITLQAQAGAGLSYGTLSALYSAVLTGVSVFTTTTGQGFYAMQAPGGNSAFDVNMDVTGRTA